MTLAGNECTDIGANYFEDPITKQCVEAEPAPDCEAEGLTLQTTMIGGVPSYLCVEPLPEEDVCQNVLGYFNGKQVCGDQEDECKASGGTFGYLGLESPGQAVCIPDDYDDDLPTCDSGGQVVLIEDGYVCESPEPEDGPRELPTSPTLLRLMMA